MRQIGSFAFLVLIAVLLPIPWLARESQRRGRERTSEKLERVNRFPPNVPLVRRVLLSGTPTSTAPVAPPSIAGTTTSPFRPTSTAPAAVAPPSFTGATASPFRPTTYYQYPSYPPAFFEPSNSPPMLPSASDQDQNNSGKSRKTKIIVGVVGTMILLFLVGVCCGSNQVYDFLMLDRVELRRQIDEDMQPGKPFVMRRPAGSILGFTWTEKHFALFFTTRIKMRWSRRTAIVQFLFGWISLFTTVIALFIPENLVNGVLGMSTLFLSALIVHMWYGFLRHWNITWLCLGVEDNLDWAALLDIVKKVSSSIYHNDDDDHFDKIIHWIAAPFVVVLHVAAILWCIAIYAFAFAWNCYHMGRNGFSMDDIKFYAGFGGAIFGSLIYPILFLVFGNRWSKLFFAIVHHVSLQYFEARLFGMTLTQFGISVVFKVLADFAFVTPGEFDPVEVERQNPETHPEPARNLLSWIRVLTKDRKGAKEEETKGENPKGEKPKEEETKDEETKQDETKQEETKQDETDTGIKEETTKEKIPRDETGIISNP